MTEEEIIGYLNRVYPFLKLVKCTDQFSFWDAENKDYLIEIKSRKKDYNSWIIEKSKMMSNLRQSIKTGKDFIYLTECRKAFYVWNINELIYRNYNFNWETKEMPSTTAFDNNKMILKEVGYLKKENSKQL
tara:strand:- start:77 stop:469 length:393 start_codon:yes stop_codon:yes gene_type:complete